MESTILIRNARAIVTCDGQDRVYYDSDMLIQGPKIVKIGKNLTDPHDQEIDATDILSARMNAMQRAIDGLAVQPDFALIDGNRDHGKQGAVTTPHATVVKGDSLSASIAAASILAKVSRDRYMEEMAVQYPQYAFEKHKGYPTKLHYERLDQYGPCPIHRLTFLKKRRKKA